MNVEDEYKGNVYHKLETDFSKPFGQTQQITTINYFYNAVSVLSVMKTNAIKMMHSVCWITKNVLKNKTCCWGGIAKTHLESLLLYPIHQPRI